MDIPLSEDEVVVSLWNQYKKTSTYKKSPKAIPPHNSIVEEKEHHGLRQVITNFLANKLKEDRDYKESLAARSVSEWLKEWKEMHETLFKHILKDCGDFRKRDVYFGDPYEQELYKIPRYQFVVKEISELSNCIIEGVNKNDKNLDEVFKFLGKVHYQFIRIHPFFDGNGRIGRVLTDQLATYFNLPPATSGFPRHDRKRQKNYHNSIRGCIKDSECNTLSNWIKSYVSKQLEKLA